MKVIAMYLPQFHRVRENDEWWGEGFTDWTTVKKAKPLYEGHEQPKVPLDGYYYDLMDRHTMEWQAGLMKKYGVDGVCMYHYWFRDGRRILEKPAENLLGWTDIDMPFCFCWANETWARTWSNVRDKNVWAGTFEDGSHKGGDGILLEQKYGSERQWMEHFDYLLPFFRDSRYMKVDGKPVIVIYRASGIPCLGEMLELWRGRAVASGLKGIYVIGIWAKETARKVLDAELYHEPVRARFELWQQNQDGITRLGYDVVWNHILKSEGEGRILFGGFVSYDDTPRRGQEGCLIEGGSPEQFARYLTELMAKNASRGNDLIFLNAWNEWGEGMYLEPDSKNQYGYLEAVVHAKKHYQGRVGHYQKLFGSSGDRDTELKNIVSQKDKFEHYLNILDAWMDLRENGRRLDKWFLERGYREIGIYGYGTLGKHFMRELENSEVRIRFIVDRQKSKIPAGIPAFLPEEELPKADVVVVAATFYYDDISRKLRENGAEKVVSLERIIGEY